MPDPQSFNAGFNFVGAQGLLDVETSIMDFLENATFAVDSNALDQVTIEDDGAGKARVKDGGITVAHLASVLTGIGAKIPAGEIALSSLAGSTDVAIDGFIHSVGVGLIPGALQYFYGLVGLTPTTLERQVDVQVGDVVVLQSSIYISSNSAGRLRFGAQIIDTALVGKTWNISWQTAVNATYAAKSDVPFHIFSIHKYSAAGTAVYRLRQDDPSPIGTPTIWANLTALRFRP